MPQIPRTLEPELMDTPEEAQLYDAMNHAEVNAKFAEDFVAAFTRAGCSATADSTILDLGSGTALILIEICKRLPDARLVAIDAAEHMQTVARRNIEASQLADRIHTSCCDVKTLEEFADASSTAVISNTLLHHIADPTPVLRHSLRTLQPGGMLYLRDLMRPATAAEIDRLTELHAGGEPPASKQLLHQSLHAALTLDEARQMAVDCGLPADCIQPTSDRHWTLCYQT